MQLVTRDQLEAGLARARAAAGSPDPRAGIHGPDSLTWQLNREVVNFLGGGRAILLQLAHPYVAHAIDQHSTVRSDARARFERTFAAVFAMAFGDLDTAFRAARRVYLTHTRVHGEISEDVGRYRRGDRYRANDAGALLWVHATLLDTVLAVREHVFGPLDAYRLERYYQESKRFAYLFGLTDALLPRDHGEFRAYWDATLASGDIAVGRVARELADFVLEPPLALARPLAGWYRVMTAGLLPEPVRRGFGMRFGRRERAMFRASGRALSAAVRALPRSLRYLPVFLEAEARLGLDRSRGVSRLAHRLAATGMGIWPRPG
ncbi:MAG TPA: oxygenase MpaB family protein [Kofleriaceae bacterium]|nr:oxygenase MpaB family protein [Kofleriaceae bacterium]